MIFVGFLSARRLWQRDSRLPPRGSGSSVPRERVAERHCMLPTQGICLLCLYGVYSFWFFKAKWSK